MSKEVIETVAIWANVSTVLAVGLNVIALFYAARQLRIGRRSTSAGALISLNESFRQAWLKFSEAQGDDEKQYAFADVMNIIEIACVVFEDRLLTGRSGKLLEDYLCHILILISDSEDSRSRIEKMFLTPKTFEHSVSFLAAHRREVRGIKLPISEASD